MLFTLERIVAPEEEPVTLAELKRHLREFASVTDNDADLNALLIGGREWAEDFTGRALLPQTWRLSVADNLNQRYLLGDSVGGYNYPVGAFYSGPFYFQRAYEIMLRRAPVVAITKFVSVDPNTGIETALPSTSYELREKDSKWPRVVPLNGASLFFGIFRIDFTAGFDEAELVPVRFKQAIKLWAEAHYDRDPEVMKLYLGTESEPGIIQGLLKPERADLQIA